MVELGSVGVGGGDFAEHLGIPTLLRLLLDIFKSGFGGDLLVDVQAGLFGGYEGNANSRNHRGLVKGEDGTETCRLGLVAWFV